MDVDWPLDAAGEEQTSSTWEMCAISPLVPLTLRRWREEVASGGAARVERRCCVRGHIAFRLSWNSVEKLQSGDCVQTSAKINKKIYNFYFFFAFCFQSEKKTF